MQNSNILQTILLIFSNNNLIGTISSSLFIVFLGFLAGRKNILPKITSTILSDIILKFSIPALSFNAFMSNFAKETFEDGLNLLIWSFILHILLIFLTKYLFPSVKKELIMTIQILTVFGGVTVFGIPIIQALYGDKGIIYASIYCIAYRLLLYSYGYMKMSDLKLDKATLRNIFNNPVILATFLGISIWLSQNYMPQVLINGQKYGFLRIDKTMFWLYKPMSFMAALCSPLSWLAMGVKLSEVSFKESITNKLSWHYATVKVVLIPIITLLILSIGDFLGIFPLSNFAIAIILIMAGTPSASIVVAYAIKYEKEPITISCCSLLSTIFSIFFIPIIVVGIEFLKIYRN